MTDIENTVLGSSGYKLYKSVPVALTAGAANIEIDVDPASRHWFAGIVYYSDAEGTVEVTPSAGSAAIKAKSAVQPQDFQTLVNGTVVATSVGQADWSDNTTQVRAEIGSIVGASYARLLVSGNLS